MTRWQTWQVIPLGYRESFSHSRQAAVDAVRAWRAPFNPSTVVAECADLLRRYAVRTVRGDRFGAEWVAEAFRVNGVSYDESPLDASTLYLEMLPAVNAGQVELLDLHDLRYELIGLERRRGLSGRDRVVHPPSRHDDLANSVAGLVHLLRRRHRMFEELAPQGGVTAPELPEEYRDCRHCGTEHLTTKQVPDCPQLGWTRRDVLGW